MRTQSVVLIGLVVGAAVGAEARTIPCSPGGNAAIQACLDEASEGDEVVFAPGLYVIDPGQPQVGLANRGGLTLRGASADDPPQFRCSVGSDGRPSPRNPTNSAFNFAVSGGKTLPVLRFEDLRFADCYAAIAVVPADTTSAFSDVQVRGVEIENGILGVVLQGVVAATVERNLSHRTERPIIIFNAPGRPRAEQVTVSGNELRGPCADLPPDTDCADVPIYDINVGIQTFNVALGEVSGNRVMGFARVFPVSTTPQTGGRAIVHGDSYPPDFHVDITHNALHNNGNGVGVGGVGRATGAIACNKIYNSSRFGVAMVQAAHGWTVGPNEYRNNDWADIFLIGPLGSTPANHGDRALYQAPGLSTFGNTLLVSPRTVVQDEGYDNQIVLTDDLCAVGRDPDVLRSPR